MSPKFLIEKHQTSLHHHTTNSAFMRILILHVGESCFPSNSRRHCPSFGYLWLRIFADDTSMHVFFLWTHSVPVVRPDYLWVSCCMLLGWVRRGGIPVWLRSSIWWPLWSLSPPKSLPFWSHLSFTAMMKAVLKQSSIDSYTTGVYTAGENGALSLEVAKCLLYSLPPLQPLCSPA